MPKSLIGKNGKAVNASHSLLDKMDLEDPKGCPRKGYAQKMLGIEEEQSPAMHLGIDTHEFAEAYLKALPEPTTSERGRPLHPKAASTWARALPFMPKPKTVHAEDWVSSNQYFTLDDGLEAYMRFVGKVDFYKVYTDTDGKLTLLVGDLKTRSSAEWAPDERELAVDKQVLRYLYCLAVHLFKTQGHDFDRLIVQHVNVLTKSPYTAWVEEAEVDWKDVQRVWDGTVEEMHKLYKTFHAANDIGDLEVGTVKACNAYGRRCPAWDMCDKNPERRNQAPVGVPVSRARMTMADLKALRAKKGLKKVEPKTEAPTPTEPEETREEMVARLTAASKVAQAEAEAKKAAKPAVPSMPAPKRPVQVSEVQARVAAMRAEGSSHDQCIAYVKGSGLDVKLHSHALGVPAATLGWTKDEILDLKTAGLLGEVESGRLEAEEHELCVYEEGTFHLVDADGNVVARGTPPPPPPAKKTKKSDLPWGAVPSKHKKAAQYIYEAVQEGPKKLEDLKDELQAVLERKRAIRSDIWSGILDSIREKVPTLVVNAEVGLIGKVGDVVPLAEVGEREEPLPQVVVNKVEINVPAVSEDPRRVAEAFGKFIDETNAERATAAGKIPGSKGLEGIKLPAISGTDEFHEKVYPSSSPQPTLYIGCLPTGTGTAQPEPLTEITRVAIAKYEERNGGVYWALSEDRWHAIDSIVSIVRGGVMKHGWQWPAGVFVPNKRGQVDEAVLSYLQTVATVTYVSVLS